MKAKEYPTIEVVTKYGTLKMTFTSPSTEMQQYHMDGEYKNVPVYSACRLEGFVKINSVEIEISSGCVYAKTYRNTEGGKEQPVTEFRQDHQRSYNRKKGAGYGAGLDYQAGYSKKWHELVATTIRDAYEAHPELIAQAEHTRLHNAAADAYRKCEQVLDSLEVARKEFAKAFDAAYPKKAAPTI